MNASDFILFYLLARFSSFPFTATGRVANNTTTRSRSVAARAYQRLRD